MSTWVAVTILFLWSIIGWFYVLTDEKQLTKFHLNWVVVMLVVGAISIGWSIWELLK